MDVDSFIVHIKTWHIYTNITEDAGTRFDTSSYKIERPLSTEKKQKSDWVNERWIKWENHEKTCWIKSKNIKLFKMQ